MDIRRIVIFVGLAITSYLLIINWNKDYGSAEYQQAQLEASISQETAVQVSDAPDTASAEENAEAPDVEDQPEVAVEAGTTDTSAPSGKLISVETDVLKLEIDPRGGEVVSVRLPAYPKSNEQKDVPFTLLEDSPYRTFVAQSGLLGRDGIDKDGGALYSAAATSYTLNEQADTLEVVLTTQSEKATVEKIFTFTRGSYLMDVRYKVRNTSQEPWQGVFYAQLKRDGTDDPSKSSSMGMQA